MSVFLVITIIMPSDSRSDADSCRDFSVAPVDMKCVIKFLFLTVKNLCILPTRQVSYLSGRDVIISQLMITVSMNNFDTF